MPLRQAGTTFDPEWRLYARGAADDKAPIVALMTAVDATRAAGLAFNANVNLRSKVRKRPDHRTSKRRWRQTRTSSRRISG